MPVTTIIYDADGGSDTLASGSNAPATAVTGTNGDITGSTLTLNGAPDFDLTGAAVGGVVWVDTPTTERHLFTIASFTGGIATCTAIVFDQTATAARTADNWAVGGKRQNLVNDTGNTDLEDAEAGWRYELEAGTYAQTVQHDLPGVGDNTNGYIQLFAAAGASPTITWTADARFLLGQTGTWIHIRGLSISNTTSTWVGADGYYSNAGGKLIAENCAFDTPAHCLRLSGGTHRITGCDLTNSAAVPIIFLGGRCMVYIGNNVIHDGAVEGISMIAGSSFSHWIIVGNVIRNCVGDGINLDMIPTDAMAVITNNVIHANNGNGLQLTDVFSSTSNCVILNNIFTNNGGDGIALETDMTVITSFLEDYNAFRLNTGVEVSNITAGANDVTLTADPYFNEPGNDFRLNNTAGGGLLLKNTAYGYAG